MKHGLTNMQVPDNYLRAIFGSYLASRFVYEYGVSASQFAFFDFMNKRMAKGSKSAAH
jgi:glutamate dehydrogenase